MHAAPGGGAEPVSQLGIRLLTQALIGRISTSALEVGWTSGYIGRGWRIETVLDRFGSPIPWPVALESDCDPSEVVAAVCENQLRKDESSWIVVKRATGAVRNAVILGEDTRCRCAGAIPVDPAQMFRNSISVTTRKQDLSGLRSAL